jgi:hypothetical protein
MMGFFKTLSSVFGGKKMDLKKIDAKELARAKELFRIKADEWANRADRKQRLLDAKIEEAIRAKAGARRDSSLIEAQGLKKEIRIHQSVQNKYRYLQQVFTQVALLREGNSAEGEVAKTLKSLKLDIPGIKEGMVGLLTELDSGKENIEMLLDLPSPSFQAYEDDDLARLRGKVEEMIDARIDEGGKLDDKALDEVKKRIERELD